MFAAVTPTPSCSACPIITNIMPSLVKIAGFSVDIPDIDRNTPDIFTGQPHNDYLTLDWRGEWINSNGGAADDDDFLAFAIACDGKPVAGDQFNDW